MSIDVLRFLNEQEWLSGAAAGGAPRVRPPDVTPLGNVGGNPRSAGPCILDVRSPDARSLDRRSLARRSLDARPLDMRSIVEASVIPRLREAVEARCGGTPAIARADQPASPSLDWLADQLQRGDGEAVNARIAAARRDGTSLERIYLGWLMPAAAHLAQQLEADLRGLAEATLAFCTLGQVLRGHAAEFCAEKGEPELGLRALLVAPAEPGVDPGLPVFGLLLMTQFFRRDGWEVRAERDLRGPAFNEAVLDEWFDLVEVLATSDRDLDAIADGIRLIRRTSPNPAVGVIACGGIFQQHPELVRMVGADRSASDPLSSLSQATFLIANGAGRRLLS